MSIEDQCFTYQSSILSTLKSSWVQNPTFERPAMSPITRAIATGGGDGTRLKSSGTCCYADW